MDEEMDLAVSGEDECCQTLVTDQDFSSIVSLLPADSVCRVCGDSATGMYFGALVCVPCKVFILSFCCVLLPYFRLFLRYSVL